MGSYVLVLLTLSGFAAAGAAGSETTLDYRVDWRLWHAGDIRLVYRSNTDAGAPPRQAEVSLKTRGFVNSLFHVDNRYTAEFDDEFCADSYVFEVREGSKRRHITADYGTPPGRVTYVERDLVRDRIALRKVISVPGCVHEELGALARLRTMKVEPGETVELPVSNGKKSISARVDAIRRETIKTPAGRFDTIRHEIFLFNNVLYRRSGRLLVWLTDDDRRLPVRFQVRLRFYFGTITLDLTKEESH